MSIPLLMRPAHLGIATFLSLVQLARVGGLAVIHRSNLVLSPVAIPNTDTFESLVFNCKHPFSATIALIYRPPKPHPTFISDIHSFLISLCTIYSNILVIGDFNVHMDSQTCRLASDFKYKI